MPTQTAVRSTKLPDVHKTEPEAVPAPVLNEKLRGAVAEINIALDDALFDFNQYHLRNDALESLRKAAEIIRRQISTQPGLQFQVEGHADERGSPEYNLALGDMRARKAQEFLLELGIPGGRLTLISYGESQPLCSEAEEACWQKNRRAHLRVIGQR